MSGLRPQEEKALTRGRSQKAEMTETQREGEKKKERANRLNCRAKWGDPCAQVTQNG